MSIPATTWTTAYASALADPADTPAFLAQPQSFRDQTIRQAVRLRRGGSRLRLVLSNEFGQTPLVIDTATVSGAQGKPPRTTTLRGSARWEIPPGQTAASDPVQLPVAAGEEIAVTCYVAGTAGPAAFLPSAQRTGYAAPGNQAAQDQLAGPDGPQSFSSLYWITRVLTDAPAAGSVTRAKERKPIAMSIPATMRALQQTSLDGPQDLRLITDAPVPSPGPGEVLIRVTAAGVNFVDISQARGTFAGGPQPPYLAGIEGAGEVTAVGEGVTGLEPGAHVIGVGIAGGAFAEYMVLPAAAAVRVPAGWADEQALGLVVSWPTALAALKPLGCIAAGQTVLIHAAAGGTGQAAVKMAKHYGATVIAAASPGKHEVVRALGADHVLDSRDPDLAAEVLRLTGGAGADLVLEASPGSTLGASLTAAKRVTGRVVVYGVAGGQAAITSWELVYKHQIHIIGLNIGVLAQAAPQIFGEVMGEMFGLMAAGVLTPGQPTAYELADGPKALTELEARATVGKLALLPRENPWHRAGDAAHRRFP